MTSRVPEMPNQFEDLIPKHPPPSLSDPVVYDTMYYVWGWIAFFGALAAVLLVLALLFILAMKIIYWTSFAVTRGVHNGWNEPPPRSQPKESK